MLPKMEVKKEMKKLKLLIAGMFLSGMLSMVTAEEAAKPAESAKPAEPAKTEAAKPAAPAAKQAAPGQMKQKSGEKSAKKYAPGQMKKAAGGEMKKSESPQAKVAWKCAHCNLTSDHAGKCAKCGAEMQKM